MSEGKNDPTMCVLSHPTGRIQVSSRTHQLLTGSSGICSRREWQPTGGVEVKGKGNMDTFLWREFAQQQGRGSSTSSSPRGSEMRMSDMALQSARSTRSTSLTTPHSSSTGSALTVTMNSGAQAGLSALYPAQPPPPLHIGTRSFQLPSSSGSSGALNGGIGSGLMALRPASLNTTVSNPSGNISQSLASPTGTTSMPSRLYVNGQPDHPVSSRSSAAQQAAPSSRSSRASSYLSANNQGTVSSYHSRSFPDNTIDSSAPLPPQIQQQMLDARRRRSSVLLTSYPPTRISGSRQSRGSMQRCRSLNNQDEVRTLRRVVSTDELPPSPERNMPIT